MHPQVLLKIGGIKDHSFFFSAKDFLLMHNVSVQ